MANFLSFFDKIPFFSSTKRRSIIIGCILGLFFVYLVRSCTSNNFMETTYHIGQDSRWADLHLMGKERNLSAFNHQLLSAIAKQEKFHFSITLAPAADLVRDLENGKLQGIVTALRSSYLNEQRLIFSDPYFLTGPVLIIPSTAPLDGWNELRKKIIAIPSHSPILASIEQDPTIQTKIYDDILRALSDLSEHRIDGAIFPAVQSYTYVHTFYKNELKIATLPLTDEGIRLAAQRNEAGKELVERFNQGIAVLKANGEYHKLLERWGLVDTEQIQN